MDMPVSESAYVSSVQCNRCYGRFDYSVTIHTADTTGIWCCIIRELQANGPIRSVYQSNPQKVSRLMRLR